MLPSVFGNGDTENLRLCWLRSLACGMVASLSPSPASDGKQSGLPAALGHCPASMKEGYISGWGHQLLLGMRMMGTRQTTHFFTWKLSVLNKSAM